MSKDDIIAQIIKAYPSVKNIEIGTADSSNDLGEIKALNRTISINGMNNMLTSIKTGNELRKAY